MNKSFAILAGCGLVVGLFLGFVLFHQGGILGSQTVNYSNSGGSSNLYNELNSIVNDIANLRNSAGSAFLISSSTTAFPAVTSKFVATSSVGVAGVANNDMVLVSIASSSVTGIGYSCVGQGNGAGTVLLTCINNGSSSQTAFNSDAKFLVFPVATFGTTPALNTVTSTSN